jgi:hypothetical protein
VGGPLSARGAAVASRLGFVSLAGRDEVDVAFALGLFGFPSSRVSSLSSLSFFFSDPSTFTVRSARLEFAATVEAASRVSDDSDDAAVIPGSLV